MAGSQSLIVAVIIVFVIAFIITMVLLNAQGTVEAVGKEAGFGSRRTFQMEVKRRLGITPLQFRQGMRGTIPKEQ